MLLSISVQGVLFFLDVNECSYAELNACPEKSSCVNLEGHYSCHPQHQHTGVTPRQLSPRKEGKKCRSHLGKYWGCSCRTLCSFTGGTCWDFWNTSSPSPPVRRKYHINLLPISDWNAGYLFHSPLLFHLFHPQVSSLTCQNLLPPDPDCFSEQVTCCQCTSPASWETINGIISTIFFFPVLTAAQTRWWYDPTPGCCAAAEPSAASSWSLALAEIIPCGTSSAKYTCSPQTSMGLLIGFKLMRLITACRFDALVRKQFLNPLISKLR